jgi:CxxC-x17-CxxC domain-containing protein
MAFTEKTLTCADCGKSFPFSISEQEFFASKGFTNEPRRCSPCRSVRKNERLGNESGSYANSGPRQMYPATCAQCHTQTEVPFQPRGDKPVLCRDCFTKSKNN